VTALTDPDPNILKSAAAYLLEVARSTTGRRHRKQAKIDALRECKGEILEAYRSGLNIHRIAQIFRERNVDISTQHLMRAIRLFIAEEERSGGRPSSAQEQHQGPVAAAEKQKAPVTYQIPEQTSSLVREEEFAKQLRLARYLAASSLPPARALEPALEGKAPPKRQRSIKKPGSKAKAGPARQKAGEAELARERRRAGQVGRGKAPASGPQRGDKQRSGPGR
jgi:hypothetical protein